MIDLNDLMVQIKVVGLNLDLSHDQIVVLAKANALTKAGALIKMDDLVNGLADGQVIVLRKTPPKLGGVFLLLLCYTFVITCITN